MGGIKGLPIKERFENKFIKNKNGCWIWEAALTTQGYGAFCNENGKTEQAHRFSYKIYKSEIKSDLFVCHRCDNPKCVNPNHLFLGTASDNINDAINKNRIINNTAKPHPNEYSYRKGCRCEGCILAHRYFLDTTVKRLNKINNPKRKRVIQPDKKLIK